MDFNTLLEQAKRLNTETLPNLELPQVERTISQVLQDTRELHSRVTQTGTKDIQAHILLGSAGIDLPKITQKLEQLTARNTFEPLDPIAESDIQAFLKNERENAILTVIEEVNKSQRENTNKHKWANIQSDWKQEKLHILNSMIGPSQNFIDIERLPEKTVLNETSLPASRLNRIEMRYAKEVMEYNQLLFKGCKRPNLVQKFASIANEFNDKRVNDIWSIMKFMVDGIPIVRENDPIKMRQKLPQFIEQAKHYLEHRYKVYMQTIVSNNLRTAQRGGVPNTCSLVNAFITVNFNSNNIIGLLDVTQNKPLWPLVYYCLRCGEPKSAIEFLRNSVGNIYDDLIQVMESKYMQTTQVVANNRLVTQLKVQYSNKIRNSTDPYKKAVYCIVLGCDAQESHAEVARTVDDFLWIQLSILRKNEHRDHNIEQMSYAGLQSLIIEKYGETHFNASEQAHVYFSVLALTGQFEAAIEFLSRKEKNRSHAVHIAIALNELCLLGAPRNVQQPLLSIDVDDPKPLRRLNLSRLLLVYTRKFERTDTEVAMHYFYFLRNFTDRNNQNLFLTSVCDLALETAEYDTIFGTIDRRLNRVTGGLFEQFNSIDFDTSKVAAMVANELVRRGRLEPAVYLFDIATLYDDSIKYLNLLLSQVVNEPPEEGTIRERLAIKVDEYYSRLKDLSIKINHQQIANTFYMLRQLLRFFDFYHSGKHTLALEILDETKLIPMTMNDLDKTLHTFKNQSGEIVKIYPDIMIATMDILDKQFRDIKSRDIGISKEHQLRDLRESAKAINNFASTIPYRLPSEISNRLVQTEIMMH